ncbi:MAG TPA: phage tail protein [Kofleriaceae bacterium]|nr:phage tail protein [Kofleriaceae bacterium]
MPTALPRNPLRNYQFRVAVLSLGDQMSSDTPYVAGVRTVSGLRAQIAPSETWEGGNNFHRYANPSRVTWEPITLETGLALDSSLEDWARAVLDFTATGKRPAGGAVKRQVVIDLWDENVHPDGPPALAPPPPPSPSAVSPFSANLKVDIARQGVRYKRYHVFNAWISKYAALPKLDSLTSEVSLFSVELTHEGWTESTI